MHKRKSRQDIDIVKKEPRPKEVCIIIHIHVMQHSN